MSTGMAPLPPWIASLLPAIAVVVAILVVVLTVAAVRQLRASAQTPKPPPAASAAASPPEPALPIGGAVRRAAARLEALRGGRHSIDAVPLLVAIGAGSADVQRMIPDLGASPDDLARAQKDLFRGGCRISLSPGGAVVSFEDGLLGSDRREARWSEFVEALLKSRSERPFDGLVIVLPAGQFFGPSMLSDDELVVLGEHLYQLIWMAQRAGGWRVPIYLVVNKCEVLTGFSASVAALAELPSQMQRTPLGWTVPYSLDTVFERSWVREGIDALTARLSILQSRLLIPHHSTETAEQLLLFPQAVAALTEPLSMLLTPMLRPSAYHEVFMFRGFYLTGAASAGTPADAPSTQDAFAARLMADRVFPEHALAQPAHGATTRAHRRIRIAQAVLAGVVLLALLGVAKVRGHRQAVDTVSPLVEEIGNLGDRLQTTAATQQGPNANTGAVPTSQANAIAARRLLRLMSGLALNHLETPWAPLSYITNASGDVEAAIRAGYQVAVLRAVYDRLTNNIPFLLGARNVATNGTQNPSPAAACGGASTGSLADVEKLQQITTRLDDYGESLLLYQQLPNDPRLENLKWLLEFALSVSMPAEFSTNYHLYESGLRGAVAPFLDINLIRNRIGAILRAQFARAIDGVDLDSALARGMTGIVSNAGVPTDGTSALLRLQRLNVALHTVQAQAPRPEYAWLGRLTNAPPIEASLGQLEALALRQSDAGLTPIDVNLPAELRKTSADCAARTRAGLLEARVFGSTTVLTLDQGTVQLSPALVPLLPVLDNFLAQPVATVSMAPVLDRPIGPDMPLFWNPQDLQSLQTMAEAYLLFAAQDLPTSLPPGFRDQVQGAAGEGIDRLIQNAVSHAQERGVGKSGTTGALRDEIARFTDAAPILTNLRTPLREAGRTGSAERLDQLLSGQAIRLLRQVDALLTAADPYQMVDRTLSFWSGTPPLAAAAFGAASLPELVGTLPARRDYVEALAHDHAAPLVTYLQQSGVLLGGANVALLTRWQSIIATLDRYHRGDPANSLARLEQFISADMDRIDLANCGQLAVLPSGGADWFAEQLSKIRGAVVRRCSNGAYTDAVALYGDLAGEFNRNLAGRFPFGAPNGPDADPADVKRFYNRFGADLATLRGRLAGIEPYARAGTPHFVDQLIGVQTALAPMLLDPSPDAPLTYDVAVEFRTNVGSDPGANQVVEVSVQFGQQLLSSFAASKSLTWSIGQSAQVLLRWATNAPTVPADTDDPPAKVRGLVAAYGYGGRWALLRLLAAQSPSAAVLTQLSDRRPEMVTFVVPLKPNPDAAAGGDPNLKTAQVFMRFGLTAILKVPGQPNKNQPVALPAFPAAAPQPGGPAASASGTAPVSLPPAPLIGAAPTPLSGPTPSPNWSYGVPTSLQQ